MTALGERQDIWEGIANYFPFRFNNVSSVYNGK